MRFVMSDIELRRNAEKQLILTHLYLPTYHLYVCRASELDMIFIPQFIFTSGEDSVGLFLHACMFGNPLVFP